jgi:hypothetical protein
MKNRETGRGAKGNGAFFHLFGCSINIVLLLITNSKDHKVSWSNNQILQVHPIVKSSYLEQKHELSYQQKINNTFNHDHILKRISKDKC